MEGRTSGPRPLQLALSPVLTAPPAAGAGVNSAKPLRELDTECNDEVVSIGQTPPSLQSLHNASARATKRHSTSHTRRQSSISYIHSVPSSPFQSSFRRESVDVFMKSPLSEAYTFKHADFQGGQQSPGLPLSRSNSISGPLVARNETGVKSSNRASIGLLHEDSKTTAKHLKERCPVTLVEKHAELLQFIAQKESKCLELRSQLAMHEAELLQLKCKWERIVNRRLEKSQAASSPESPPLYPSPSSSPTLPAASTQYLTSPHSASSPYFHLLPSTVSQGPVLEGIKGSVQGMSRLIAAGLESIAGGPMETPSSSLQSSSSPQHGPLPLLLGSVKVDGNVSKRGHGQNGSQSSSSTNASFSTSASQATTNTNATSIRSSSSLDGPFAASAAASATKADSEGQEETKSPDISDGSSPCSDRSEQVLIVRDTGATPTMSPNPDFERKRRLRKLNESAASLTGNPVRKNISDRNKKTAEEETFNIWPDANDSVSGNFLSSSLREQQSTATASMESASSRIVNGQSRRLSATMSSTSASKSPPSALLPMSTIPGMVTMSMATPAAQQMSSWVGSVGKRIRDSSTFSKNQKRASLLLSDMQNTFVSALISSTPSTPTSTALTSKATEKQLLPTSAPAFASNASFKACVKYKPQPTTTSLLDDSDTDLVEEDCRTGQVGIDDRTPKTQIQTKIPVLVPSTSSAVHQQIPGLTYSISDEKKDGGGGSGGIKAGSVDWEDDWNW